MNKTISKIKSIAILLTLIAGSLAMATESQLTDLDINAEMESLIAAKSVSFSISPMSQPIRVKQLNGFLLSSIVVDKYTSCSLMPVKTNSNFTVNSIFSGTSNNPQSVFKSGYSVIFGTFNYFKITLTGAENNQLILRCDSESLDLPTFNEFQKAFARFNLNLSVGFSE